MKKFNKKERREIKRITEYVITGGAWFWSGYAMFALLYSVVGLDIVPAKIISYIFGLTVNFILERLWVFKAKDPSKQIDKVTFRYLLLSAANLGIDTLIVWGLAQFGVTPYIGQFVSAGFFTVWNYLWYKLWVFARNQEPVKHRPASPALRRPKHERKTRVQHG
jgi:putative flippase GtrA